MTYSDARQAGLDFYIQVGPYGTYCPTPVANLPGWHFGDNGQFFAYSDAAQACAALNDKARAMA